ncbi:MAG: hypothetical protein E7574_07120 [Ruminococcaceae bacterium]|nr:hypothetical protein [Oscillospiraceae bacterium]
MKNKIIKKSILCVFVFSFVLLCLISCGEKNNEIIGTWETKIPHTKLSSGSTHDDREYMKYVDFDNVYKRQVYEFDDKGFYKKTVYVDEYIEDYKNAVFDGIKLYYAEMIAKNNLDITVEEALEADKITKDSIIDSASIKKLKKEEKAEGKYKVEEGNLYLSAAREYEVDESIYITYSITETELVFKKQVGGDVLDAAKFFPLAFTKTK